ncbi:MAG: hypothetical protein EB084_19300 [Proteobacteria bacterium]|nr:hypothetical protein [Pseudomonadota bacterium]
MSDVYMYADLDAREYLMVNALGGGSKVGCIGRNLGARALGLLLLGRWAGHRVQVVGESDPLFEQAECAFTDVASAAAALVLARDGPDELLSAADGDARLYVLLGQMAFEGNAALGHAMAARFGAGWKKRLGR